MPAVSAVIATFERPDACERALLSALEQDPAPLEVLVCDDASADTTAERFRAWELRDPRVRYLRIEPNTGYPSPVRNLGTKEARGEWVAFLDDDDIWLPGKLRAQLAHQDGADVITTNARTTSGALYFPAAPPLHRPTRREMLAANPVIQSSAMARRDRLLAAGGFPEKSWLRGIEDYAAWLAMADRDARFLVLGEPLVEYNTHVDGLSTGAPISMELASAGLALRRAVARPRDPELRRAVVNKAAAVAGAAGRRLRS